MKNLTVTVNGVAYQVTVEENTGAPVAPAAPAAAGRPGPGPGRRRGCLSENPPRGSVLS